MTTKRILDWAIPLAVLVAVVVYIAMPPFLGPEPGSKRSATKARIMAIDSACRLFDDDMEQGGIKWWPPVTCPSLPANANDGDHALFLWLTGHGDVANGAASMPAQSHVHGPYGGAENFDKMLFNGYPVFVDAWGGTIHYDGSRIWAVSPSGEQIDNLD